MSARTIRPRLTYDDVSTIADVLHAEWYYHPARELPPEELSTSEVWEYEQAKRLSDRFYKLLDAKEWST